MDIKDNSGKKIGSLTHLVTPEKSINISQHREVTTIQTLDRTTGKGNTETFIGKLPFGS